MRKSLLVVPFFGVLQACNPSTPVTGGDGGTDSGVANLCTKPTGAGTKHMGDITADTTWTAADSPHIVTFSIGVKPAATLTIEPCAEVRIQATGMTIDGKLVARGDPSHRITITADDPTKPFTYIRAFGSIDLASVDLSHGGDASDPNGLGVIDVRQSNAMAPTPALKVVDVSIDGSDQWGVSLRENATFSADSSGLTIKNAKLGAIRAEAPVAGSVPAGAYTGNTVDEILVIGNVPIVNDATWKNRGVPYRIGDTKGNGNDMRIGAPTGSAVTTLTIEDATVKVSKGGRILINNVGNAASGALVATGTTFTSAESAPGAGDWVGLYFGAAPDPKTKLDKVRIEYAGGPSLAKSFHCDLMGGLQEEEDSAIIILGFASSEFVTNSTIVSSAGYGIDRGWHGAPTDFVATNTFMDIAKCKQSYPRDANGGCPMSVPCP